LVFKKSDEQEVNTEEPTLVSDCVEDKNGHILLYVKFHGGKLELREEAIKVLNSLK